MWRLLVSDGQDQCSGNFINQTPNGIHTSTSFTYDGRFPGQRFDRSTGTLHNGFRTYSPKLGRYIQSDPLGLGAGWNTFSYVGGDPVSSFDPLGLTVEYPGPYGDKIRKTVEDGKRQSSHLRNIMTVLELSTQRYVFRARDVGSNQFNSNINRLRWNKDLYKQCISLSPTDWLNGEPWMTLHPIEGLVHEIGHAYRDEMRHKRGERTPFFNTPEEWATLVHEQIIIDQLSNGARRGRGPVEYFLGD